jgi:thermitase
MRRRVAAVLVVAFGIALVAVFATRPASEEPVSPPRATAADDDGAADDPRRTKPSEVLVGFEPGSTEEARGRAARGVSAERQAIVFRGRGSYPRVELLKLPRGSSNSQAVGRLRQDRAVAYAEPNWIQTPAATSNDPYFTNRTLWGMYGNASSPSNQYGSQAAEAWTANHTGSREVYVGVIDEGIQYTHPDLNDNAWSNPYDPADGRDNDENGFVDDIRGWDFAGNNNSVYDGGSADKHGTHVTGTIGAERNGAGVVGVNWDITYISGKFLARNGGTTANAIKAVDYFTDLKVRHGLNLVATNNSWGGGGSSQALLDAINRGGDADILFVAATGNGGSDGVGDNTDTSPYYPSSYTCTTANRSDDCVISVAALTSSGSRASYSNYGLTKVDLGAPGSGVYSTLPSNKYGAYSGTSMATPHVTGAAALYRASHPSASAAEIRKAILEGASATPTSSMGGKTVTGGRLNADGF